IGGCSTKERLDRCSRHTGVLKLIEQQSNRLLGSGDRIEHGTQPQREVVLLRVDPSEADTAQRISYVIEERRGLRVRFIQGQPRDSCAVLGPAAAPKLEERGLAEPRRG